ncbi:hypothetical protein [Kibdelosporangium phytohabitans]|uniref:Uncharacterized protein n=1 Tax=Kibdelosporangium phytohabitans TaxID=860235 RepID=A0A0N9HTK0_9PSEU|nr:hypothetical protein [Kibdelosporangium phytohabitans]ALG06589.1 hypothetical protein AOZ06_06315 [Kibdelosporangium phytohabitans]MBE1467786.1 hypothetical protein [Kibdelosporangium phytohabitans]
MVDLFAGFLGGHAPDRGAAKEPEARYVAEVQQPSPGVRPLVAGCDDVGLAVQIPARVDGLVGGCGATWR